MKNDENIPSKKWQTASNVMMSCAQLEAAGAQAQLARHLAHGQLPPCLHITSFFLSHFILPFHFPIDIFTLSALLFFSFKDPLHVKFSILLYG